MNAVFKYFSFQALGKKFNDPCDANNGCGEFMSCSAAKSTCECSVGYLKTGVTCSKTNEFFDCFFKVKKNTFFKFYLIIPLKKKFHQNRLFRKMTAALKTTIVRHFLSVSEESASVILATK